MSLSNSFSVLTTILDNNDDDFSLFSKSSCIIIENADESSIDFFQLSDKQCVLYSEADMIKINLFWKWWNLILFNMKLTQQKQLIWKNKLISEENVWSHFQEKVNIIQKQFKILCKYCEKTLIHSTIKKSEINALHKHLILRKYREMQVKIFSAQNALNSYYKIIKTVRIYHIHLLHLLTFFRLK